MTKYIDRDAERAVAEKETVLYYLGAGASANRIPVLDGWKNGLESVRSFLKTVMSEPTDDVQRLQNVYEKEIDSLCRNLDWVAEQVRTYHTFDTFAKVLFNRGSSAAGQLKALKIVVTILIWYFQLSHRIPLSQTGITVLQERTDFETRYDSLLSYLVTPKASDPELIPRHCRFISWNYDTQFELSLYRMVGQTDAVVTNITQNRPQFFKVNGTVGTIHDGDPYHLDSYFNDQFGDVASRETTVARFLLQVYKSENRLSTSQIGLKYAWEQDEREIMSRIDSLNLDSVQNVVIVGYSFPFFNRDFDSQILSKISRQDVRFYLQYKDGTDGGSESVHEDILEKINGFGLSSKVWRPGAPRGDRSSGGNVFMIKDVSTFYIPYGV